MNWTVNPNDLLNEIDLIEQLIVQVGNLPWLPSDVLLKSRVRRDVIIKTLDELTRPQRKSLKEILTEKLSHIVKPQQALVKIGFEYMGDFVPCASCLGIHRKLLMRLFKDFPEKREIIVERVNRLGYNRIYISNEREDLFHKKDLCWIRKHSEALLDGWYIDKNVNPERIHKILPVAVSAAGLTWDADVRVIWA